MEGGEGKEHPKKVPSFQNSIPEFLDDSHKETNLLAAPCEARVFLVLSPYSLILKTYKLEA